MGRPKPVSKAVEREMKKEVKADPVTLRVIGGALEAAAKEMAQVLYRMSYSSIIRESEDLGAGLFDARGRMIAESDSTPLFTGAMPYYIAGFMKRLGDDIHEGDAIMHNHPYYGATHSPDVLLAVPIFWKGELVAFAGSAAQWLDVGGAAPGLLVDVVDVWAEAKLMNAIKVYERGKKNIQVWRMIFDNMRTQEMNEGDAMAQIAACELAKKRFLGLVSRYGFKTVMDTSEYWMDYSENMMRHEIARVPEGTYHADGWLDDDGKNRDRRLKVNVTVKIKGSDFFLDLTGSSPEVETGYNVPFEGSTITGVNTIARSIFLDQATYGDTIPQNDGTFRPVHVHAPEGTIFNPRFPRSCFARFNQVQRVADCIIRALHTVIPEKTNAGNSAHIHFTSYSGYEEMKRQYWVYLEVNEGSYGGRSNCDGIDSVDNLCCNTRNRPIEELELQNPLRIERYELRDEPPAVGQWRGGLGIVRETKFLTDGFFSCEGDRHTDRPWGAFGGGQGLGGSLIKNPGSANPEVLPSKVTGYRVRKGEVIQIKTPSGGGWGDPTRRDPKLVLDDVVDGYISLEMARSVYRVSINPDVLELDLEETARLRGATGGE
jgi:N-methylhydantoinase B/oxoprolinase/acetone carboxylase alpha subunit